MKDKRKKKKLDEVFESYSFSDTNIASLFFREDAIKSGQKAEKERAEEEITSIFDDSFDDSVMDEIPAEETVVEEITEEKVVFEGKSSSIKDEERLQGLVDSCI